MDQVRAWCEAAGTKVSVSPVIDLNQRVHVAAYEVPDRIDEHIVLRDVTCVFPYCTKPAERCDDDDHAIAHAEGGQTATDNLAPLCRTHHRSKTHSGWDYVVETPGSYLWTSPRGLVLRRDHTGTAELEP